MLKTIIFSLRLNDDQYKFLEELAKKQDRSIGQVIRRLIDMAMRSENI